MAKKKAARRGGGSTALQVYEASSFPIVATDDGTSALGELFEAGVGKWDFTRIRMPSGGSKVWEIDTADGLKATPTFIGVLAFIRGKQRAFWPDRDPSGEPPRCRSDGAQVGEGDPSLDGSDPGQHECEGCPNKAWGSLDAHTAPEKPENERGPAQHCTEHMHVFICLEGEKVPVLLVVSPGSLRTMRDQMMKLMRGGKGYHTVVHAFGLEPATAKNGTAYSRLTLKAIGDLPEDEAARMYALRMSLAKSTTGFNADAGDLRGDGD